MINKAADENESETTSKTNKTTIGLSVTVGLLGVALLVCVTLLIVKRRQSPHNQKENNSNDNPVFQAA